MRRSLRAGVAYCVLLLVVVSVPVHTDAGDRVEVTIGTIRRTVVVSGVAEKRGPARVAATLYEETTQSVADRERHAQERRLAAPLGADLGARPTKQARRRLEALRRWQQSGRTKRGRR